MARGFRRVAVMAFVGSDEGLTKGSNGSNRGTRYAYLVNEEYGHFRCDVEVTVSAALRWRSSCKIYRK
ncbi:unnamed protein product [Closterium sp. Yama58-4]|nr:unnamed protein product [Closterium sp. Yama58-4]